MSVSLVSMVSSCSEFSESCKSNASGEFIESGEFSESGDFHESDKSSEFSESGESSELAVSNVSSAWFIYLETQFLSQSLIHLSVFSESVVSAVSDSLSANKMHTPQLAYCTHSTFRVYCHHPHKNKFHKFNVYVC